MKPKKKITDERREELAFRKEVLNDPDITPLVKRTMVRFWAKVDAIEAKLKHYPKRVR